MDHKENNFSLIFDVHCTMYSVHYADSLFTMVQMQVYTKAIKRGHSLSQVANVFGAEASASVRRYVQKQTIRKMHTQPLVTHFEIKKKFDS
jgi:hypothetical protein